MMIDVFGKTVQEAADILLIDLPHYPSDKPELEKEIADTREAIEKMHRIIARSPCRTSVLAPRYAVMLGHTSSFVNMNFTTEEEYRKYLFRYQLTLTTFSLLITFKNRRDD